MALGPYREDIQFDLFTRRQRDGTLELMALFKTPINGWRPNISVWLDKNDPATSPEDTITVLDKTIAYCISDDGEADYDDLQPTFAHLVDPAYLFAIGSLMRRVI